MSTAITVPMTEQILRSKIASMNVDQIEARLYEIADSNDRSPEALLETAKLLFGPEASVGQDV